MIFISEQPSHQDKISATNRSKSGPFFEKLRRFKCLTAALRQQVDQNKQQVAHIEQQATTQAYQPQSSGLIRLLKTFVVNITQVG